MEKINTFITRARPIAPTDPTWSPVTTTSLGKPDPNQPGPLTSHTSNIWLWAILTVVSAVSLRAVLLWGRRGGKRKEGAK